MGSLVRLGTGRGVERKDQLPTRRAWSLTPTLEPLHLVFLRWSFKAYLAVIVTSVLLFVSFLLLLLLLLLLSSCSLVVVELS